MRKLLGAFLTRAAIATSPAVADTTLELDPGVAMSFGRGGSNGRSIYLTADETFTIDGVGLRGTIVADSYDIVIYQGRGVTADPGSVLQTATADTGGQGDVFNDIGIVFTFETGLDYIVNFRPHDGNTAWATSLAHYRWGNDPADDVGLDLVTIRDGRAGFAADNWVNTVAPAMRLHVLPAPSALAVLAMAGVVSPRRRRR
ncbi:MAG: hypothetical protein ACYSWT_08860 [Planctomycetota bacterium]|jgi:hypothetical protein